MKYGARHLKRAIEKFVVYPLANLLATEQIRFGDMLVIDWDEEDAVHLHFTAKARAPLFPRRRGGARAQPPCEASPSASRSG